MKKPLPYAPGLDRYKSSGRFDGTCYFRNSKSNECWEMESNVKRKVLDDFESQWNNAMGFPAAKKAKN